MLILLEMQVGQLDSSKLSLREVDLRNWLLLVDQKLDLDHNKAVDSGEEWVKIINSSQAFLACQVTHNHRDNLI